MDKEMDMETRERPKVLIVDDKPANLTALIALLEELEIIILKASTGNEALSLTLEHDFALVLLDVQMPGMDGFETAELMRLNQTTRHVPIIFVTAISKEQHHIFRGYEAGAVDYIFKPLDPHIIKNKVKIFVDMFCQKQIINHKNSELKKANQKILEQQDALVEEERLKVLLQMAGAAAHELNQPLMILLGNLEILELVKEDHDKVMELVPKIQKAGESISKTVKKIQNVRYDITASHDSKTKIIDLNPDICILSVEDSDQSYNLFKAYCNKFDHIKLHRAKTIDEAMSAIHQMDFTIILLDYDLPDGTGLDLLEKLNLEKIDLPVVAITGKGDEEIASSFLKAGAFDYLSKTKFNRQIFFDTINAAIEKFGLKKEIEHSFKKMAKDSTMDQLTGLYNRRYMDSILQSEAERARRYDSDLCALMLDLDFFKNINDTHGHLCGDFILQQFSNLLMELKRESDYIFRYGGEEFVLLIPQTGIQGALQFAERIRAQCQKKEFVYNGIPLGVTVSIGVSSLGRTPGEQAAMVIEKADKALYQAKTTGRNCVSVYNPG